MKLYLVRGHAKWRGGLNMCGSDDSDADMALLQLQLSD